MPESDTVKTLFEIARQHAIDSHRPDEVLAVVTALEGLALEVQRLRITIERSQE